VRIHRRSRKPMRRRVVRLTSAQKFLSVYADHARASTRWPPAVALEGPRGCNSPRRHQSSSRIRPRANSRWSR
jgi:hypothetical protein